MDYTQEIVDILNASAPLVALLTGGIFNFNSVGRKGINPMALAQAYDANNQLRPCCVVWTAEEAMDGQAVGFVRSTVTPVYGRLYDNGNAGFDTLAAAEVIIYGLLNQQRIPNALQFLWGKTIKNLRDSRLSDAALYSFNGKIYAIRSS